jgi:hypothetical protein
MILVYSYMFFKPQSRVGLRLVFTNRGAVGEFGTAIPSGLDSSVRGGVKWKE